MSGSAPPIAIRATNRPPAFRGTIPLTSMLPVLVARTEAVPATGTVRRTKIWEFNTNLHCSIIGTCLSTAELRQILKKLGLAPPNSSDHDLHGVAVTLAGRHDSAARLLNKALDARHKLAIGQFSRVDTEDGVRRLWREAVQRGEIPGAYWAALTHSATSRAVIREAFGDVHMLSHLVGAANRADIRRLCQLEADKAALEARLERQQHALREAIVSRDARITDLQRALTRSIGATPVIARAMAEEADVLRDLVADLERRVASEIRRRASGEARLAAAQAAVAQERSARIAGERDNEMLRQELTAIEDVLAPASLTCPGGARPASRLDGMALLYVGARPHQIAHLRAVSEGLGALFLYHDGGIEHHVSMLPGLVSRADMVLFPADCISHEAVRVVKVQCRQGGKRFIPLRSASATSLLAVLRQSATTLAEAAV